MTDSKIMGAMATIPREMVLFPSEMQFDQKSNELMLEYSGEEEESSTECYWTVSKPPKNSKELIGSKVYFYDKAYNRISMRATVLGFIKVDGKNAVLFRLTGDDVAFRLDFDELGYAKRKQFRGWCYRWWRDENTKDPDPDPIVLNGKEE